MLESLFDQPVAKIIVITGLALIIFGLIGKIKDWINLDKQGRIISFSIGILFLAAGFYMSLAPNSPPDIISVDPDKPSPHIEGALITWTAKAEDHDNDLLYYRFFIKSQYDELWLPMTNWTTSDSWICDTSDMAGNFQLKVEIADSKPDMDDYDCEKVVAFTVKRNKLPEIDGLVSDQDSPKDAGTIVKWIAKASDPENDDIYYSFSLKGPSTGGLWEVMAGRSPARSWSWNTLGIQPGNYSIQVEVTDEAHFEHPSAYDLRAYSNFVVTSEERPLEAPIPLSPKSGTSFNHFPRNTTLEWEPVSGAASYMVETEFYSGDWFGSYVVETPTTSYSFDFVGAQPGRWRVWAVGPSGDGGAKSDWWYFEYSI